MAVVITGFGARSPLGCSFEESMETLRAGTPCIGDIQNLDTRGYPHTAAGEIRHNGQVVRTDGSVDRKTHFLDQALEELSAKTAFTRRYSPGELMLNIGSGVDSAEASRTGSCAAAPITSWPQTCVRLPPNGTSLPAVTFSLPPARPRHKPSACHGDCFAADWPGPS